MMNLQIKKTAALRDMAEEQKIKGWEDMSRKDLIVALKEEKPAKEPEKEEPKGEEKPEQEEKSENSAEVTKTPLEDTKIIVGVKSFRVAPGSKAAAMKQQLDAQPKVKILIPLEGNKFGTTFPVTLNGYRMNILMGIYVDVPQQVADVVMDSQKQTLKAIQGPMRRLSPDGLPMRFEGEAPFPLQ